MGRLDGRVAVLTGATDGLALASAQRFADEGARVFITGRDEAKLNNAVESLGSRAVGIRADSAQVGDLDKVFRQVEAAGDKIDVLVVSAGLVLVTQLGAIKEEDVRSMLDLNVIGTIFTVQKALPLLNDGASVILIGSIATVRGFPGASVYAASKAAIRTLGRSWAAELVGRKIRVNTLSPGPTDTAALQAAPDEMRDMFKASIPMGRLGLPDDIASAALFLASDDSSFITGIELSVDGGRSQL